MGLQSFRASELREPFRRGGGKSVRSRGDGGSKENKDTKTPSTSTGAKLVCMSSQRPKQQLPALHRAAPGALHICHGFQFNVFMEFLRVWTSGSLIIVILLGSFSSVGLL